MLQKIRDRATGPLAWFIVGIICVPFAFFGIESFRSSGPSGDVAKVGDEKISDAQLQQEYQSRYQQLQQMLGENFRPDFINPDTLRASVLDGLIQDAVNRQYLAERNYRVSDQMVLQFIRAQDAFQDAGNFSPQLYRDMLARQGMNPIQYEDRVRAYLASQQLRQGVVNTAVVTERELAQQFAFDKQARRFAHRRYSADAVAEGISIEDAAIEARYEERKASLMAPERIRVEYLELDINALKADVEVSEEAKQALYEAEKDTRFAVPEERLARHILIRASDEDAQSKIQDLAAQLADGADFAELAQQHSQDPGSRNKGGDLGWVARGMMVAPFEEALFAGAKGEITAPVESEFGWHLIEIQDVREASVRPYEDERTQRELSDLIQEREARERFDAMSEQLEQLAFENPASLQPAAEALSLPIQASDWFTRQGGEGLAANEAVVKSAFSDLVLRDGENSLPLAVGRRQIVLRKLEHEPERPQTLDEVRERLRAELIREAVAERLNALVAQDLEQLEAGDVAGLAALENDDVARNQPEAQVQRSDGAPNRALIAAAFELPRPAPGEGAYQRVQLPGSQDLAIVELSEVIDADWSAASEADREQTRRQLQSRLAGQEYAALEAALRERAKVKVYRETF